MPERPGQEISETWLGVDFGTNHTTVASSDARIDRGKPARILAFPGCSRFVATPGDTVPIIPSQIHYRADGSILIGDEVDAGDHHDDPSTARWMRHYVAGNSGVLFPAGDGR